MILSERIRLPYPWIKIKNKTEDLLYKLSLAEDEEDSGIFLFKLYLEYESDLEFFTEQEQDHIKQSLTLLICETLKHGSMIAQMIHEIKTWEVDHEERTAC